MLSAITTLLNSGKSAKAHAPIVVTPSRISSAVMLFRSAYYGAFPFE